jgi:hypothetical protein
VPGEDGEGIMTSIKKANERLEADECLPGTEGGITVAEGCDITVGIDDIGRCTRRMCHRAFDTKKADEAGYAPELPHADDDDDDDDNDDDDDDDDDDDIGEEI